MEYMQVAANADDYAAPRVNIFFTANNQTPADGNLTGQCVTLVKWFMAEMADVPNPFAARGHARYLGANLVAQGLANLVPAGQQKRGDIVCYEYGEYGHTGVLLSGNRLFQQNANAAGTQRRVLSDGTVVYSSSIAPLYGSLGGVAPKFYRLNSYVEGEIDMKVDANNLKYLYMGIYGQSPDVAVSPKDPEIGQDYSTTTQRILDYANRNGFAYWQYKPVAEAKIATLQAENNALSKRPTQDQLDTQIKINELQKAEIDRLNKEVESLKAQVGDNSKWETFKALVRELFNVTK
jgi:hypothetical protein